MLMLGLQSKINMTGGGLPAIDVMQLTSNHAANAVILVQISQPMGSVLDTRRNPCPYLPPGMESRDAYKGKQLIVQTPKPGKHPSTFFEKEHPYIAKVH